MLSAFMWPAALIEPGVYIYIGIKAVHLGVYVHYVEYGEGAAALGDLIIK